MIKGKYKRIVAYGCSFTAGDELGDSQGLGIPEEKLDALKRSGTPRSQLHGNFAIRETCIKLGKELTWVRWLSDKYSIPYSNRAHAGGSLPQMVFRIERDYRTGLIKDDDLVLVGVTSMYRWFQFSEDGKEMTWVLGNAYKQIEEFNNSLIKHYINDYNILWNYHLNLNYLEFLAKEKQNIKLFHALAPFSQEKTFNIKEETLRTDFRNMINSFKFTSFLDPEKGLAQLYSHIPEEEATHGYGHPKVKYQKEFANLLYAWIEEKVE